MDDVVDVTANSSLNDIGNAWRQVDAKKKFLSVIPKGPDADGEDAHGSPRPRRRPAITWMCLKPRRRKRDCKDEQIKGLARSRTNYCRAAACSRTCWVSTDILSVTVTQVFEKKKGRASPCTHRTLLAVDWTRMKTPRMGFFREFINLVY